MIDALKRFSPEDLKKINTWQQEIENCRSENIDSPPEKVVNEHEVIYNGLTEEQKQKWDWCTKEAEYKYYAIMEDLGYENPREKFTFFKPYLTNIPMRSRASGGYIGGTNRYVKIVTSYFFEQNSDIDIVSTIVHENIHANDYNVTSTRYLDTSGLDVYFNGNYNNSEFVRNLIKKIYNDNWELQDEEEVLIKSLLASNFENMTIPQLMHSDQEIDRMLCLLEYQRDVVFNYEEKIDGANFNEGTTEYFTAKYTNGFEGGFAYRNQVDHIKRFVDSLPNLLKKSFERALMDAKILSPKDGGGYPLLTRWFAVNLNLRITPLTFLNLDLDRADIQARLDEIKNSSQLHSKVPHFHSFSSPF